eukprot:RCo031600
MEGAAADEMPGKPCASPEPPLHVLVMGDEKVDKRLLLRKCVAQPGLVSSGLPCEYTLVSPGTGRAMGIQVVDRESYVQPVIGCSARGIHAIVFCCEPSAEDGLESLHSWLNVVRHYAPEDCYKAVAVLRTSERAVEGGRLPGSPVSGSSFSDALSALIAEHPEMALRRWDVDVDQDCSLGLFFSSLFTNCENVAMSRSVLRSPPCP